MFGFLFIPLRKIYTNMEHNNRFWQNPFINKICIIIILALFMLIPLSLITKQVGEREYHHNESLRDITGNWGHAQTFYGPMITYKYLKDTGDKDKTETISATLYPDSLKYVVNSTSKELHRSIFDVSVYTADISIQGYFILDEHLAGTGEGTLAFNLSDLKGIQGNPVFVCDGKELKLKAVEGGLNAELVLDKKAKEGDRIPFHISMRMNGSESIFFKPVGSITEVEMNSDYPNPSFSGDFLPVEREVREDGFTAKWLVSQITLASLSSSSFGVKLVKPVTQYRQTERATKYGLLVIFLVFIAGFVVEIVSKKPINIIQYLVIGASLVLFYSLLLAFSDFMSFGLSYLIAASMTVIALCLYFAGIVKSKWAIVLTGLVALAYGIIYILLQMETFAFLTGTLLLFFILCIIMALTRNLKIGWPRETD